MPADARLLTPAPRGDAKAPSPTVRPMHVASAFLAAYALGDGASILAMSAPDAVAEYVPWGDKGRNPIRSAVKVWATYPEAFSGFAMPVLEVFEDLQTRTAIVATRNVGKQRKDVDGIVNKGGEMSCPHLFVITLDEGGLIERVQVWCDQVTLYTQLGFPEGFAV